MEQVFGTPMGFSNATDLNYKLATVSDYRKQKITVPEPGTYAVNNGVIAACTSDGKIVMWIPMSDSKKDKKRAFSFSQALESLKEAGYTEKGFAVPVLEVGQDPATRF